MKSIKVKEIKTTPLILSILTWYINTLYKCLVFAGKMGLIITGLAILIIVIDVPYWAAISVIAAIAAVETGWIVYKAFQTGKVKWKKKKRGENDEHL